MKPIDRLLERYGEFIAVNPYKMLAVIVVISLAASVGYQLLSMKSMNQEDMLPEDIPVVESMNYIGDEFGGTETANIVVQIRPGKQVTDVRKSKIVRYMDLLARRIQLLEDVQSASSVGDLVDLNGRIPKSDNEIKNRLRENARSSLYVSEDYSTALIRLSLSEGYDEDQLYSRLEGVLKRVDTPEGVESQITGNIAVGHSMKKQVAPDMQKTSKYSLIGVLLVVLLLFRSLRFGLISLLAIGFGLVWTFGLLGLIGLSISSQTAGAASMIMGIGIDFGIQLVNRFKLELEEKSISESMVQTIKRVATPIATTTLAALIGLQAMSMGKLTILSELGRIMSLGVLSCMIAALTVIPTALVLTEKYFGGDK